jgi:hypothetical protein
MNRREVAEALMLGETVLDGLLKRVIREGRLLVDYPSGHGSMAAATDPPDSPSMTRAR